MAILNVIAVASGIRSSRGEFRGSSHGKTRLRKNLLSLFRRHFWRILPAYILINAENVLVLVLPSALGFAVSSLLKNSWQNLLVFLMLSLFHMGIIYCRRIYDARIFNQIYADIAAETVSRQGQAGLPLSQISARSSLSRCYAEFYQQHIPIVCQAVYCIVGSLAALLLYDHFIALCCLFALPLVLCSGVTYLKRTTPLNSALHDQLEQEVDVIQSGRRLDVKDHYSQVASWRVHLAKSEALSCASIEMIVMVLMAIALLRSCRIHGIGSGEVLAIVRYITLYATGLDAIPFAVQQFSRIVDISGRMHPEESLTVQPSDLRSENPTVS